MQEVKRTVPDGKSAAQDRKSTAPDGKSAALDEKPAIKAAFFDIDGTLFSHRTQFVPESTLHALKCLREKGILCIIAHIERAGMSGQLLGDSFRNSHGRR